MIDLRRIQPVLDGLPVQPGAEQIKRKSLKDPCGQAAGEFARELEKAKDQSQRLHFSAHALERMAQRGIELSQAEFKRMQGAIETAAQKGSRSSLVLLNERAFVVSVANRTVITALEGDARKDQIVTQIDSAVIL